MKKREVRHIIDQGLVVAIALVIAAAISFTGGTVLAIAHLQPFHHCNICDTCNAGIDKNMVAVDF